MPYSSLSAAILDIVPRQTPERHALTVTQVTAAQSMMGYEQRTFGQLVSMSREGTDRPYPTVPALARRAGVSRATAFRDLKKLREAQWVVSQQRPLAPGVYRRCPKARFRSNVYSINTAKVRGAVTLGWQVEKYNRMKAAERQLQRAQAFERALQRGIGLIDETKERRRLSPTNNNEKAKVEKTDWMHALDDAKGWELFLEEKNKALGNGPRNQKVGGRPRR